VKLEEKRGEVKMGLGPHTRLERPAKLDEIVGKPTGQGFGAARKGPSVVGKPQDVVVDEDYQQGKAFKVED
jgi:hypothetical protein